MKMKFAFFPMALHLTPQLKVSKIFKEDFAERFGQSLSLRLSCLSFYFQFLCVPFSIFSLSSFVFLIIVLSSSLDIYFWASLCSFSVFPLLSTHSCYVVASFRFLSVNLILAFRSFTIIRFIFLLSFWLSQICSLYLSIHSVTIRQSSLFLLTCLSVSSSFSSSYLF